MKFFLKYLIGATVIVGVAEALLHPYGFEYGIGVHPTPTGTPWTYQLFSGFLPALVVLQLMMAVWMWYYHHTCQEKPLCLRWGKYEVAGGIGKKCHVHHPDLKHHDRRHHGMILDKLHEEWKRAHGAP